MILVFGFGLEFKNLGVLCNEKSNMELKLDSFNLEVLS